MPYRIVLKDEHRCSMFINQLTLVLIKLRAKAEKLLRKEAGFT